MHEMDEINTAETDKLNDIDASKVAEKENMHGNNVAGKENGMDDAEAKMLIIESGESPQQQRQGLLYTVDSRPPWYITLAFAFQQILSTVGSPVAVSFIIHRAVCADGDLLFLSELIGTTLFMCGLCTFIQVTFGIRLPMIQGSSVVYVPIVISMMSTPQWKCPSSMISTLSENETLFPSISNWTNHVTHHESREHLWKPRMLEASGALVVAASFQVLLGVSGTIGFLMRFVGPLTIAPTVTMIGFSLVDPIVVTSQHHWGVALVTAAVFLVVSTILNDFLVPFPAFSKGRGCHSVRLPIFRLFPQIFAFAIGWVLCLILTLTGQLPDTPGVIGFNARTDSKTSVIADRQWLILPYPGQWGMPTFSIGIFFGMISATICSIIESVGDYLSTARVCDLPVPPKHAMNRGIAMEGLGSVFCGFLGTAHATTSYSNTVGFIPLTGMASRQTWQVAGVLMMAAGMLGKCGAVLSSIPDPIVGGSLLVTCGMIISVALINVQFIDMKSGRNLAILGLSLMMGAVIPTWIKANPDAINTGNIELDNALKILLEANMLISGTVGCLLDNLIPGTREERGLGAFIGLENTEEERDRTYNCEIQQNSNVYNLPWFDKIFPDSSKIPCCCTYIPFLPFYKSRSLLNLFRCRKCR